MTPFWPAAGGIAGVTPAGVVIPGWLFQPFFVWAVLPAGEVAGVVVPDLPRFMGGVLLANGAVLLQPVAASPATTRPVQARDVMVRIPAPPVNRPARRRRRILRRLRS